MNKLMLLLLMAGTVLFGCKDKEGSGLNPNGTKYSAAHKAKLYDKVWYSTHSSGGVELQFLSSGVYRQALSLDGTYIW